MNTALSVLLAAFVVGIVAGTAQAQRPHEKWRGKDAQRCAVTGCSSPSPIAAPPASDSGSTDRQERYDRIHKDAIRVWNQAEAYSSFNAKKGAYVHALELFQQQQAIQDGPKVRDAIAQVKAMILWTSGVLDDQNKNYWDAVTKLHAAYKSRPDLFNEANFNYIAAVFDRNRATLPEAKVEDQLVVVPDKVLKSAIEDRVFYESPPGVSDRVRKGFQAVMKKDWNVARAWFQDALQLEPDNANLKSFIALVDQPERKGMADKDSGTSIAGQPLPRRFTLTSLSAHADWMTTKQIMKALEDILDGELWDAAKQR